jgi:hypothetical protein
MNDTKQEQIKALDKALAKSDEELRAEFEAFEKGPLDQSSEVTSSIYRQEPSAGFDENKSQGSMPRLYEHIDRVDLWVMAQRKQHAKDAERIAELERQVEQSIKILKEHKPTMDHAEKVIDELKSKLADAVGTLDEIAKKVAGLGFMEAPSGPYCRIARKALERIKE